MRYQYLLVNFSGLSASKADGPHCKVTDALALLLAPGIIKPFLATHCTLSWKPSISKAGIFCTNGFTADEEAELPLVNCWTTHRKLFSVPT